MFPGTPAGVTFGDSGTAAPEGWWEARPRNARTALCLSPRTQGAHARAHGSPPGKQDPACPWKLSWCFGPVTAASAASRQDYVLEHSGLSCSRPSPAAVLATRGGQHSPPACAAWAEGRGVQLSLCSPPAPGPRASDSPGGAARLGIILQTGSSSLRKIPSDVRVTGVFE